MSHFAHYPRPPSAQGASQDFELVQARYVAMPALLWAAAMFAALLVTAVQEPPSRVAQPEPLAESSSHGA